MVDRLLLGCSQLSQTLARRLVGRPGELRVVMADADTAQTLRDEGINVTANDPTDAKTLRSLDISPGVIAAADDAGRTNLRAARTARSVYPDSFLLGYTGIDRPESDAVSSGGLGSHSLPEALATVADRVLDTNRALTSVLLDRVGKTGVRMRQLRRTLLGIDSLAIITHDNPDPDAIASAIALQGIADGLGCSVEVCYFGDITHQENRAFVNLLEFDLRNLDPADSLDTFDGIALVDHSRPGVNDQLPQGQPVDIVIDHHPPRAPVEARFVDLRSDVGATSTLLVEYLEKFDIEITESVATGLLFGIRVDTNEFAREVSVADFEAAATLLPHADLGMLERIESPSVSGDTLEIIANAISNRQQEGRILLSCVGRLSNRDALAQAADRLLGLETVAVTVVYGVLDGTIYLSARARGMDVDLGETLRDAFGQIGSAGGHAEMAGAQIATGVLEAVEEREDSLIEIVDELVRHRFLEALNARSSQAIAGVYAPEPDTAEEYLVPEETEAVDDTGLAADSDAETPDQDE